MESLHSCIVVVFFNILFYTGPCVAPATDGDVGAAEEGLGIVIELVFKVQQILIQQSCKYKDPNGVCSTGSSADCTEVLDSGVCVLKSCPALSELDQDAVADLLAQIGQASHKSCGFTKEDLLRAVNGQPKAHVLASSLLLATAFSIFLTTMRWRFV